MRVTSIDALLNGVGKPKPPMRASPLGAKAMAVGAEEV
jgi:hypothetical protein